MFQFLDKILENFEKDFIIHTCTRNKARSQVKLRLRSTCLLEIAHIQSESCKLVGLPSLPSIRRQ